MMRDKRREREEGWEVKYKRENKNEDKGENECEHGTRCVLDHGHALMEISAALFVLCTLASLWRNEEHMCSLQTPSQSEFRFYSTCFKVFGFTQYRVAAWGTEHKHKWICGIHQEFCDCIYIYYGRVNNIAGRCMQSRSFFIAYKNDFIPSKSCVQIRFQPQYSWLHCDGEFGNPVPISLSLVERHLFSKTEHIFPLLFDP